jgi:hypothetical protein
MVHPWNLRIVDLLDFPGGGAWKMGGLGASQVHHLKFRASNQKLAGPLLGRRPCCVWGLHREPCRPREKIRCLRHRDEGDTSPQNGSCGVTAGCCAVTQIEKRAYKEKMPNGENVALRRCTQHEVHAVSRLPIDPTRRDFSFSSLTLNAAWAARESCGLRACGGA